MEEMKRLDPRLAALLPVIEELKALRRYLAEVNAELIRQGVAQSYTAMDRQGNPLHVDHKLTLNTPIQWIDDSLHRIEPHLHSRRWPPVWWRLGKEDFDLVFRGFSRFDGDGLLPLIPQRDEIMARVSRIKEMYKQAKQPT